MTTSRKCVPGCICKRHQNGRAGRTDRTRQLRRAAKLGTTRSPEAVAKGMATKVINGTVTRGDDVGYHAIHRRLSRAQGPAGTRPCDWCGDTARTWAYNHLNPNEKWWRGMAFSTDLSFYLPLCDSCHGALDYEFKRAQTCA